MKFPGRRKTKHYFPVTERTRNSLDSELAIGRDVYIVGVDQLLVDIECSVTDEFLQQNDFPKGQSFLISDDLAETIYSDFKSKEMIKGEYPGGAIGNTLHNYCVLGEGSAVALGAINKHIQVGDYAYKYLSNTSSLVNLSYLQPSDKSMGRALCFITEDGERTFAISRGCMDDLSPSFVPEHLVTNASALLISAYTFRNESSPIQKATIKAAKLAIENKVPVVLSLGTSQIVLDRKDAIKDFIKEYVTVLAMNHDEAIALTGIEDPLLSLESTLDSVDLALLTDGDKGLYLGGYSDEEFARETKEPLHTKSLVEYNKFEYSRSMRKADCQKPFKIYTHINPFMGGPVKITNTNGAGDAALAAILHDISASDYHRNMVPNSPKNNAYYLTYSSLSQISKYANRVSFEVLIQNSPRLIKGLPEREDNLEDAYWSQ